MAKKIAIGLSGGVDSSVAAYLLKKRGFDLVGFTLKFYPEANAYCDRESLYQAERLCSKLDIPHYSVDVTELFKKEIVDSFINSYLDGLTPNPCVWCNRLIKFGFILEEAKSFGADYLATGHYARIARKGNLYFLKKNKDERKTQEYFLSLLKPSMLKHIIFPLANYTKEEVKRIARKEKIFFKPRKESQDVCFIQGRRYPEFIEDNAPRDCKHEGVIKHIDGQVLGKHKGIYHYTYGQRGGLGIGWHKPLYVTAIDSKTKEIIVAQKEHLNKKVFFVNSLNWFIEPQKKRDITVKVRYNSRARTCQIKIQGDKAQVTLTEVLDSVAPGQIAAFYHKQVLLGAGIIEKSEKKS